MCLTNMIKHIFAGRYWQKVADERKKRPYAITLADKNAPNEEVWRQIEDMCRSTKASAVPVIPESEGTELYQAYWSSVGSICTEQYDTVLQTLI
ncbi:hypothetical protein BHE74_00040787 [Ensete ventricosum]|nr:hypothetical protein GW17_00015883 [Ensete ventricosum]RWW52778.1 hypothetical protein BHE74_00040787 [Ensete ventricosum]